MEHISSENLAIFLLAGFSGLDLFKRGMLGLLALSKKVNVRRR